MQSIDLFLTRQVAVGGSAPQIRICFEFRNGESPDFRMNQPFVQLAGTRASTLAVSECIGLWQLGDLIGEGQWTRVFAARPANVGDDHPWDFAIKVLKQDTPLATALLRREAQVGRTVSHRNLVSVLAFHVERSPHFLVTPRLNGVPLNHIVQVGLRLPVNHALWIVRQLAEALRSLHDAGWRHGDVKPENVVVDPCGHATLIDLGFCQPIDVPRADAWEGFMGSVAYAAPELFVKAYPVGGAADLYSLGVLLFEMVSGVRPYQATTAADLAQEHLTALPPSIRVGMSQVPVQLEWLVQSLLTKDPLRRPDPDQLIQQLVALEIDTLSGLD